jgi:3-isopropylmalate dehydrogenase
MDCASATPTRRLLDHVVTALPLSSKARVGCQVIGLLPGTGIGPEVTDVALRVLRAVEETLGLSFEIRRGGPIGEAAEQVCGAALSDSVVTFCTEVFRDGGAILSGPGGGRYVYDLRRQFELFCKLAPVRSWPALSGLGCLRPAACPELDLLFVRDNCGGVYQGNWRVERDDRGETAYHAFSYSESEVRRLARVAVSLAANRRGRVHVIVKRGGVPAVSELWQRVALEVATTHPVQVVIINADFAAFELVQHPELFDVILTPNLFGDILVDLSAVLQGSRGVTFSGNFAADGRAVYQTNHGCAHDLAGTDTANPAGQLLALAMLLRESFAQPGAAALIESGLTAAWDSGCRTADLAVPGCQVLGTRAMGEAVVRQIVGLSRVAAERAATP